MEWYPAIFGLAIIILILSAGLFYGSTSVVKTNYARKETKTATVYYYLPESTLKIKSTAKVAVMYNADDNTLNQSTRIIEQSFAISTEMIADTRDLLSLNYTPNALMSDDIKYGVNSRGLLETVNVTTDDRTADLVSKLAEAPKVVLGSSSAPTRANNIIAKIKEYSTDFVVRASRLSASPDTIKWNIVVTNELGEDDFIVIAGNFEIATPDQAKNDKPISELLHASQDGEIEGILTRPLKNLPLSIKSTQKEIEEALPFIATVADVSKLIVIPIERRPFVKRVNKVAIQDGIVLSNEINNPSSVEGFVSIPINVAKAIVSIPAQLITFRIDNTKKITELEKERLNLEKSIQESQKFAFTKEQEIEKLKLDLAKAELSKEIELKKLKLELEKGLLEAEKSQLAALKALEELKKDMEKLKGGK